MFFFSFTQAQTNIYAFDGPRVVKTRLVVRYHFGGCICHTHQIENCVQIGRKGRFFSVKAV